jgi:DNA-binding transcriptional LysR family regulator
VSRHVSRLEQHMGGRLLQRTTRSLALTELGSDVHEGCARLVSTAREVQALAGAYSTRPSGVLLVSAPVAFSQVWLAPRLPAFLQANPDVDVRLTLMDRPVDLIEEGIDLGIRIARDLAPGLAARKLMEMRYVLVASPAYLAAQGAPERPHDLLRHDCIYLGHAEFGQRWTLRCAVETCTVDVRARLSINNSSAILAAVEAGGGVGLIPEFTAQPALQAGRVLQLLPEWDLCDPYRGAIYAVYTPGRHIAPKIRAFIDYLAAAV